MSKRSERHPGLALSKTLITTLICLLISSCSKETIIREVPAEGTDQNTALDSTADTTSTGNMVSVGNGAGNTTGAQDNTSTEGSTDTSQLNDPLENSGTDTTNSPRLQEPDVQVVSGSPGLSVDCNFTLPCRWVSADEQLNVTLTNADNIGAQGNLQLYYAISTLHDTKISVPASALAEGESGTMYRANENTLGQSSGHTTQSLLAGNNLNAKLSFTSSATDKALTQWSVTVLDGGTARTASFNNIPIGSLTNNYADCNFTLPCSWVSPLKDVSITLTVIGNPAVDGRLSSYFTVKTALATDFAVDAGSIAVDTDGNVYEGRTHELAGQTGSEQTIASNRAGASTFGVVNFSRTPFFPTALEELNLIIYPDSPEPRWNPKFTNIPVQ